MPDIHKQQETNHTKDVRSNTENLHQKSHFWSTLVRFSKKHIGDTIAYALLAFGLVLAFFDTFMGGLLVGLISGLYFSKSIVATFQHFQETLTKEGVFRGFIIIVALLTLAISAPGLILGLIVGAVVRPVLKNALSDHLGFEKKK